jgi:hypothetical protein
MHSDSIRSSDESHRPQDAAELPVVCLKLSIADEPLLFLVDTGSSVNIVHHENVSPGVKLQIPKMVVSTLGGKRVTLRGMARNVQIFKGCASLGSANFVVVDEPMKGFNGILGAPFLNQVKAMINFQQNTINISVHQVKFVKRLKSNLHHCTATKVDPVSILENLAKWKEVVNNESVILRNTDNICFPSWHVGMLKVHCPENYRDEILLVEPTTLPNSLVIGGAVIQPNKDAYIPVMNVSNEEVRMKRGAFVAHGAHITDPRMLIGLEEEFTEEEYVNFVSRGRERVGADSDVTERKEKVSQEVKSSGRGKVEKEGATRKSSVKMKLENSDFKGNHLDKEIYWKN